MSEWIYLWLAVLDGSGWFWLVLDGSGWFLMVLGGSGWFWMVLDGSGWFWIVPVFSTTALISTFDLYLYMFAVVNIVAI